MGKELGKERGHRHGTNEIGRHFGCQFQVVIGTGPASVSKAIEGTTASIDGSSDNRPFGVARRDWHSGLGTRSHKDKLVSQRRLIDTALSTEDRNTVVKGHSSRRRQGGIGRLSQLSLSKPANASWLNAV